MTIETSLTVSIMKDTENFIYHYLPQKYKPIRKS